MYMLRTGESTIWETWILSVAVSLRHGFLMFCSQLYALIWCTQMEHISTSVKCPLMNSNSRIEKVWMCSNLVHCSFWEDAAMLPFSQCREKLSWVCNWVIVSHTRVQWTLQSHISKGSWPSLSSLKRQRKLPKNPSTDGKWEETSGEAFQRKIPPSWSCSGICGQERKEILIYREVRAVICFSLFSLYPSTLDLKWKSGYDFKVPIFNSFKCSHILYMSNAGLRAEFIHSLQNLWTRQHSISN